MCLRELVTVGKVCDRVQILKLDWDWARCDRNTVSSECGVSYIYKTLHWWNTQLLIAHGVVWQINPGTIKFYQLSDGNCSVNNVIQYVHNLGLYQISTDHLSLYISGTIYSKYYEYEIVACFEKYK